jgi:hypothetical protein
MANHLKGPESHFLAVRRLGGALHHTRTKPRALSSPNASSSGSPM